MIDHEEKLEHVYFSHVSYSLLAGSGSEVHYDLPALEKHILERFLCGRPLVVPVTVPCVNYKDDALKHQLFAKLRKNIPQVSYARN